jgi:hypothetical protein
MPPEHSRYFSLFSRLGRDWKKPVETITKLDIERLLLSAICHFLELCIHAEPSSLISPNEAQSLSASNYSRAQSIFTITSTPGSLGDHLRAP